MPKDLGLEELRVLSEKATQGEWSAKPVEGGAEVVRLPGGYGKSITGWGCVVQAPEDAAFIVACVNYVREHVLPLSGMGKGMGAPAPPSGHSQAEPFGLGASPECPSRGWETIATAPDASHDLMVWVFGGHYTTPKLIPADGSWWRWEAKQEGTRSVPTHWQPLIVPQAPALGTLAREGQDRNGLGACPSGPAADQAATPTLPLPPRGKCQEETFETIAQWCEDTFGPIDPARIAERTNEEMIELLADPERVEEAADVVIVLSRYPKLWEAVQRKMAVNRARKWRLMGDGTGYHVKEPTAATPTEG